MGVLEKFESLFFVLRHPEIWGALRIPTHLTPREMAVLYRLARGKRNIVEIGSYLGASASCLGSASDGGAQPSRVICIDSWRNHGMTEGDRDTFHCFLDNTRKFSRSIVPLRGFSAELAGKVAKLCESIDLLFIDGDHSYRGVKSDWDAYRGLLRPGAIVAFHDWGWAEGVKRVIFEDVQAQVERFDHLPNLWWGWIK